MGRQACAAGWAQADPWRLAQRVSSKSGDHQGQKRQGSQPNGRDPLGRLGAQPVSPTAQSAGTPALQHNPYLQLKASQYIRKNLVFL
jgi:hypothetical protein